MYGLKFDPWDLLIRKQCDDLHVTNIHHCFGWRSNWND